MLNQQAPERYAQSDGSILDLHSMFFTIQGEGPFTGHRSVFVRLAGCNLQCPGCDTEYTQGRQMMEVALIVTGVAMLANDNNARGCLVVITGGEPLRQCIGHLVDRLVDNGHKVQIESNGMFSPDEYLRHMLNNPNVTLVVSPKTSKINPGAAKYADYFKYVMRAGAVDPTDGLPTHALEHVKGGRPFRPDDIQQRRIYLNPYDEKDTVKNAENLAACAKSAMEYGYVLGVQLHKLIGLE